MKNIVIASDHGGYDLKNYLLVFLQELGYEVDDMGPQNSESVDYPDYGISLAQVVVAEKVPRGIVICGTGIGMSIKANRYKYIRCALCHNVETAELAKSLGAECPFIRSDNLTMDSIKTNVRDLAELNPACFGLDADKFNYATYFHI